MELENNINKNARYALCVIMTFVLVIIGLIVCGCSLQTDSEVSTKVVQMATRGDLPDVFEHIYLDKSGTLKSLQEHNEYSQYYYSKDTNIVYIVSKEPNFAPALSKEGKYLGYDKEQEIIYVID